MPSNYAKEILTVSTAAVPLTAATYSALMPLTNLTAFISVEGAMIRFFFDGSTPTATVGHTRYPAGTIELNDFDDIKNFKAIRDTSATGDATLTVTYKDKKY